LFQYWRTELEQACAGCFAPQISGWNDSEVKRARQDLRTLMDFWRATLLPFYPAWLKEVLLAVASALAKALAREPSTAIRALAGAALGDIPLPETIDMLKVHANDSDQTVRAAVQQSIASIQLALRDQTPALDWTQ
jgi:HEAT repeat protein